MAITIEQWKRKQAQCPQGWKYSQSCHHEDKVVKTLSISDSEVLTVEVYFSEVYEGFKYTGLNEVMYNISRYEKTETAWVGMGLGVTVNTHKQTARKTFKLLTETASTITDDMIWEIAKDYWKELVNGRVL